MSGRGKELPGPIRDDNSCHKCKKPMRQPGCHDICPDHAKWTAEKERVKENRRKYEQRLGVRIYNRKFGGK